MALPGCVTWKHGSPLSLRFFIYNSFLSIFFIYLFLNECLQYLLFASHCHEHVYKINLFNPLKLVLLLIILQVRKLSQGEV